MQERINYVPEEVVGEVNRDEQSDRIVRLLEKLDTPEITGSEESKREYMKQLDFEGFKKLLLTLNGNLMAIPAAKREFFTGEMELASGDRESPLLGWAEGTKDTYTPLQQDKDELLQSLFNSAKKMVEQGASMQDMALLAGTGINAIHAFKDGNGRTSRLLYYLMAENYQGTDEQKKLLQKFIGEKGRLLLDLDPSHANEEIIHYIQQEKLGLKGDDEVRVLYTNKLQLRKDISKAVKQDFKKYIFAATSASDSARGLGALATYSVVKNRGKLLEICRYAEDNTRISADKLGKHLRQEDLEQMLQTYWELKKESIKVLFDALSSPATGKPEEMHGLEAIKTAFLENRDRSERESVQEVNQQNLRPIWTELMQEPYTQQEIPPAELSIMRGIRAKAMELSEQDAKERSSINFDFTHAEKELEDFRKQNRVDIELDPEGYNVFANKLFDKEREIYAPLIEVSERNLQQFMAFLDQQQFWSHRFATRRPYGHTTEDRQTLIDSFYYITPSGCSLRLLRYSVVKDGLKIAIQPFMEKVIYLDDDSHSHDSPNVGLSPVEYVTDDFWEALKSENNASFTSGIKKYELNGQDYYVNPNDGDLHKAYPIIKVLK